MNKTFEFLEGGVKNIEEFMNVVYFGDNKEIMPDIPNESADLIYLDPPFFSNKKYEVIWGDANEIRTFEDRWEAGIEHYIGWMVEKIYMMYDILAPTGSFYLHCDNNASHYLKCELDKIFGKNKFRNEIIWKRCHPKGNSKTFATNTDSILFYTKGDDFIFNKQYGPYSENTLANIFSDEDGKGSYTSVALNAPGGNGYEYDLGYGEILPKGGYRWKKETMLKKIEDGGILNLDKPGRVLRQKQYFSDMKGVQFDNMWLDIENVHKPEYPTQKPIELIERIIKISSNKGDLVFDPFLGGGTTAKAAQKLGRSFLGIEVSDTACKKLESEHITVIWNNYGDYENMNPYEFQNWACEKMLAKNTSRNPSKPSGPDGGVDGLIRTDIYSMDFQGCPLQVKQSENIDGREVVYLQDICRMRNKKNGFIVALSFTRGAKEKAAALRNEGICDIRWIEAKELNKVKYYDYSKIGQFRGKDTWENIM